MKEATGELSGTVIVIVLLALVIALGTWLFKDGGQASKWIEDIFNKNINCTVNKTTGECE